MAAIKTQIAAADLERQRRRGMVDPRSFKKRGRRCTTSRPRSSGCARHMAALPSRRDALKDQLIEVLRADYDDDRLAGGGGRGAPL